MGHSLENLQDFFSKILTVCTMVNHEIFLGAVQQLHHAKIALF